MDDTRTCAQQIVFCLLPCVLFAVLFILIIALGAFRFRNAMAQDASNTSSLAAATRLDMWNQFRGPNGCGVADACRPPVVLDPQQPTWVIDVPPGHSSPVLSKQLIVLTAVDGDRLVTLAFRKQAGELAWRRVAPQVALEKQHEANSPAASTPCIDERACVCVLWVLWFALLRPPRSGAMEQGYPHTEKPVRDVDIADSVWRHADSGAGQ